VGWANRPNGPKLAKGGETVREQDLQNHIRVALSEIAVVFRTNVGKVRMSDGRFFDTGLPKGHPDLYGFRKSDGRLFYVEVKTASGRLRADQKKFLTFAADYGIICGVARSVEDALHIVGDGKVLYGV